MILVLSSAVYCPCRIPLTDVCSQNSCLFVIPRSRDPGYYDGDNDDLDPMQVRKFIIHNGSINILHFTYIMKANLS